MNLVGFFKSLFKKVQPDPPIEHLDEPSYKHPDGQLSLILINYDSANKYSHISTTNQYGNLLANIKFTTYPTWDAVMAIKDPDTRLAAGVAWAISAIND